MKALRSGFGLWASLLAAVAVVAGCQCGGDGKLIHVFSAGPATIARGSASTLVFSAQEGVALTIDNSVGIVTGKTSVEVTPAETTTYTLTATKGSQSETASVTVTVASPAPAGFTVTPAAATVAAGTPDDVVIQAVDRGGAAITDWVGSVKLVTDDPLAEAPATIEITAADSGKKTVPVTFKTAGVRVLTVSDASAPAVTSSARVTVTPGAVASFKLSSMPATAVAGTPLALTVSAVDAFGNVAEGYAGQLHVSSTQATDLLPADGAFASGVRTVSLTYRSAGDHFVTVTEVGGSLSATSGTTAVTHAAAAVVKLTAPATVVSDVAGMLAIAVQDAFGNPAVGYTGTLALTSTDSAAPAIADVTFSASDQGAKTVSVTLVTSGEQTISVAGGGLSAQVRVRVDPGAPAAFTLSALPATARAGDALPLMVTVRDARGNVATGFTGQAHFSSSDATDSLPADSSFASGVLAVSVSFVTAGTHAVQVAQVGGAVSATSTSVAVRNAPASALTLTGSAQVDAGVGFSLALTLRDRYGNPAEDYAGTVTLTTTDPAASGPPPVTFAPADKGVKSVSYALRTAGTRTVSASDGTLSASLVVSVKHAGLNEFRLAGLPTSAKAGTALTLEVQAVDAFGNLVADFADLGHASSADATDVLPSDFAFAGGARSVTVTFKTAGSHTVTVTQVGGTVSATSSAVQVNPGDPIFALAFPANVNADAANTASLTIKDAFGNAVPFAGAVTFSAAPDATAVVTPATLTLTGSENGVGSTSVVFKQLGAQTVTAVSGALTASANTAVHGFVYTDPPAGGKMRLVRNAAASSASLVRLDLVVGNNLTAAYGAGFNLPISASRAVAGSPLLLEPGAVGGITNFTLGTAPKAVAAALPTSGPGAGVLMTGVSQKAAGAGAKTTDTTLSVGAVVYSVQLQLAPAAPTGTVFDGNNLPAGYKAAVRDRFGKDVAEMADFALGVLEVR